MVLALIVNNLANIECVTIGTIGSFPYIKLECIKTYKRCQNSINLNNDTVLFAAKGFGCL